MEKSTKLLAPNGLPSNLTPQQWKLVRTHAFKKWFGDWENDPKNASKVVDENGEPLVVYRSISPKPLAQGYNPTSGSWDYTRKGYQYFAKNKDYARVHGYLTKEFFLNIRNILDFNYYNEILIENGITSYYNNEGIFQISNELEEDKPYIAQVIKVMNNMPELGKEIKNKLKTADGFHGYEAGFYGEQESYVVMKPEQIKLADGSNKTFDSNSDDIRYEGGGGISGDTCGKITPLKEVDDISEYVPVFFDENMTTHIDEATTKYLLKNSNIPIEIVNEVGKGFDGVAYETKGGTILKVTKNGEEAMNSFLIFKNYDNLEGQAKIYNVFIITNGEDKLYFIEKDKVQVATDMIANFPLDSFDELWAIGRNEATEDFDYWVNDLAKEWEYENNQSVNKKEMKQAFDIVDLSHRIVVDEEVFDLPIDDATPHNVGYKDGDLYCFDCSASGGKKLAKGGEVDPKVLRARWAKKKDSLENMANNIRSLRLSLSKDLREGDEKEKLSAIVIKLMDETCERVGNEESESNGHKGITGLAKSNVKINGNTITLKYVGKSGVKHDKTLSDRVLASGLREAIQNSPSKYVFETSDGFKIKNDRINRYLSQFNISAKDLRGYNANKWIVTRLKQVKDREILSDKAKRKKRFNEVVKVVAQEIGHGGATLKKHYLLPSLEREWVNHGKIVDLSNIKRTYMKGGKMDDEVNTGVGVVNNIDSDPLDEGQDIVGDREGIFAKGGEIDFNDILDSKSNDYNMNEHNYSQLPHLESLSDGEKFLLKEEVFKGSQPKHSCTRYMEVEVMGKGGMLDSLKLKVHKTYGKDSLHPLTIITRPIRNIMNKGRALSNNLMGNAKEMKSGGELNPDKKEVKNYFAHQSGEAGGVLVGKRHSEGGIQAENKGTGDKLEMEGGEVVITRNAVSDPTPREFEGKKMTNREILSKINESGGGVSFASGGQADCGCDGK